MRMDFSESLKTAAAITLSALSISIFTARGCPKRSQFHVICLHIGIRVNHFIKSWFFLKPVFSPHISDHHLDRRYAPDIGYVPKQTMKFVWVVAGAFKTHGVLAEMIYKRLVRSMLHRVFTWAESIAVAACEKESPEGFGDAMKIEEYDWKNGSPEDFHEKYVKTPKPVILRGFAKDTEAVKKWSFKFIVDTYGEEDVYLTNSEIDGYLGKLKEVSDPGIYLHNSEVLFMKYPQMTDSLELKRLAPYIKKGLGYTQLFVGLSGTGTPLHCAATWNWFTMIDGEKTWYFVDPEYSWFVYPVALMGIAASFCVPKYPDDCDETAWPLVKWCPYYKATLHSGDVLLNPPWWWHAIRNISERSVAVASRWHGDGSVGRGFVFTSEDYEINRFLDFTFFLGLSSFPFMHRVLESPSPKFDDHTTIRERKNRFTHIQAKLGTEKLKF